MVITMDYAASQNQSIEAQLLNRYGQGDEAAFRELVDQYKGSLYTFLHRFLSRHDLVEDVFQETFLQLYTSRDTFDISRPLGPWLFTIAANKAKNALRILKRRQATPIGGLLNNDTLSLEGVLNAFACHDDDPSAQLEQMETAALIRHLVASLPKRQSEILTLAYFNQFTYKQIAGILDIPLGTVKSRLHTAVGALTRKWTIEREHRTAHHPTMNRSVTPTLRNADEVYQEVGNT
jgi:RNA polymerase sigma-70 factor (ECF subfamily)